MVIKPRETIRAVHQGESRLSPSIASKVLAQFRNKAAQAEPAVMAVPTAPSKSATPAVEPEALSSKE